MELQKSLIHNALIAEEDAKEQLRREEILTENAIIEQEILKQRLNLVTIKLRNAQKDQGSEE